MTYAEFVKKYLGKGTDYDGAYGVQCVDLAKLYIDKVIGVKPVAIGDAYCYYDHYETTYLKKYFKRIPYKKGVKSQKGDLVVWGLKYDGKSTHGHIAIATGKQTDTTITTYDQNWGGAQMKEVVHSLYGVKGFLRPLDQSRIKTNHKPNVKAGDKIVTKARCICYKSTKKDAYLISDISQFSCEEKARLIKGKTVTVKDVINKGEDVWIKIKVNDFDVYLYAYNSAKDKAYIK